MSEQTIRHAAEPDLDGNGQPVLATEPEEPRAQATTAPMSDRVRALRLDKSRVGVKRPRRRRWIWLAVLAVLIAAGVVAYRRGVGRNVLDPHRDVEAITATAERPLEIVLDTTGYIIAHSVVKVSPRVPGTVVELRIEEGQKVKKDDLLARLDDGQYKADYDQAEAAWKAAVAEDQELCKGARDEDIEKARAALRQAEVERDHTAKELKRAEELKGTISPSERDRIESRHAQAKAGAEQARQALKLIEAGPRQERIAASKAKVDHAKAVLDKAKYFYDGTRILSPVTGTVLARTVELGEMIRLESLTGSFCTIADLNALEAEIDIQERDLAEIRSGQPCLITTEAYPDREYKGRLQWLSPMYNRQRGVRRVKVKIEKPDEQLSPDMNCRVQVLKKDPSAQRRDLVFLPAEAVVDDAGQKFVFVLDGEIARQRPVQTGQTAAGRLEIREGVAAGEVVLLPGDKPLEDGQKVRPHTRSKKERNKPKPLSLQSGTLRRSEHLDA